MHSCSTHSSVTPHHSPADSSRPAAPATPRRSRPASCASCLLLCVLLTHPRSELVNALHARGVEVYLVSGASGSAPCWLLCGTAIHTTAGGFEYLLEPVAALLGIPGHHVFANALLVAAIVPVLMCLPAQFSEGGEYTGFDPTRPTSRSGAICQPCLLSVHEQRWSEFAQTRRRARGIRTEGHEVNIESQPDPTDIMCIASALFPTLVQAARQRSSRH